MRALLLMPLLLPAVVAGGQDVTSSSKDASFGRFGTADRDGDGLISRAEAETGLPRVAPIFERVDTDGDGQLTAAEITQFRSDGRDRMHSELVESFKAADVDGDGALDLAEAQVGMPQVAASFMTLDADNDGKVTGEELARRGRREP